MEKDLALVRQHISQQDNLVSYKLFKYPHNTRNEVPVLTERSFHFNGSGINIDPVLVGNALRAQIHAMKGEGILPARKSLTVISRVTTGPTVNSRTSARGLRTGLQKNKCKR